MTKILIGCDPELFLRDPITGSFVSGHGVLPGNKMKPHPVTGGAVQIDGTALEFNTNPAASFAEFNDNINSVLVEMQKLAGADRIIAATPVAEYDPEYFKTIPPQALELGCEPDFNGWTMDINPAPNAEVTFRTGSGHVHIGWGTDFDPTSEAHFLDCCAMARQMDYYLGVATVLFDKDNRRRELYGKAGAFRPKSYGFEYRVPSNVWVNNDLTRKFVYDASVKAVEDMLNGDDKAAEFGKEARDIINGNKANWRQWADFKTGLDYSGLEELAAAA